MALGKSGLTTLRKVRAERTFEVAGIDL